MQINCKAIFKRPLKTISCLENTHKIKPFQSVLAVVKKEQWAATKYNRIPN